MPRRSSISRLDPRIREAVDDAIREGRATIDDLVALIRAQGGQASRSAVGRYAQGMELSLKRYRETQEIAGRWMKQFQENPDSDVGRLLAEMLKTIAFASMADTEAADPKDLAHLARAVKDLASVDAVKARLRAELAAETKERASAAAAAIERAAEDGRMRLSPEALATIREPIYGMAA
jgi:hypothetical protein